VCWAYGAGRCRRPCSSFAAPPSGRQCFDGHAAGSSGLGLVRLRFLPIAATTSVHSCPVPTAAAAAAASAGADATTVRRLGQLGQLLHLVRLWRHAVQDSQRLQRRGSRLSRQPSVSDTSPAA